MPETNESLPSYNRNFKTTSIKNRKLLILILQNSLPKSESNVKHQKNKAISGSTCKTLGVNLNIKCDTLHKKHNSKTYNSTKQRVFGFFCSISDPLGIIAFCLIEPKLIVQDSWRRKIGWNARLLQDLKERFAKQKSELEYLRGINVPRYCESNINETKNELHIFAVPPF